MPAETTPGVSVGKGHTFPFGSPGAGTSGGLMTPGFGMGRGGIDIPRPSVQMPPVQPPTIPNQNLLALYRQYQIMQQMSRLPGWAGYLQWLQMMRNRPPPTIPGGSPGPTRG